MLRCTLMSWVGILCLLGVAAAAADWERDFEKAKNQACRNCSGHTPPTGNCRHQSLELGGAHVFPPAHGIGENEEGRPEAVFFEEGQGGAVLRAPAVIE